MKYLFCDFETRSDVDIGKCGAFKYMESPEFRPLLLAWGFDHEPLKLVDFACGDTWPEEFLAALDEPSVTLVAQNNAFERGVIAHGLHYSPDERWIDTMHLFAQCGLPLSLDGASKAMGLSEEQGKMKEGKALIRYFCVPCKPTKANGGRTWNLPEHAPDKWETFGRYCLQDVEAMRTMFYRCLQWLPRPEEMRFHALDARINERGVRIDRQLAKMAVAMDLKYKDELTEKAIALTGMENPNSTAQIKAWLLEQEGQEIPSLNKKVIADVVAGLKTEDAKKFMAIRTELSKSSVKKFAAMLRSMGEDDHVRGCFQFYGANRTGRFAGRLVQFQNLSKNYMDGLDDARELVRDGHYTAVKTLYNGVSDVLSQLVRTAIIPEDGHRILVSDFSAIEARVIAWLCKEQWRLDVFRNGGDIYCASASQMFKVPVVKHGENGHLRQKGKVAELALGYGGGVNALKAFGADKMGMTDEEMQETVDLWRESSPRICALWKSLEKAAIRAVAHKGTTTDSVAGIRFDYENGVLWMTLPSGRRIAYWGARYEESKLHRDRKTLSYWGVDQKTKKWSQIETWGGKLAENCWAAGTPILTNRGWVPIETVSTQDLIWDGFGWVKNHGLECHRWDEALFELDGLLVTGDHRILTTEGWRHAEECDGLDRLPVQLPDGSGAYGTEGLPRTPEMAGSVRLRPDPGQGHPGHPEKRKAGSRDVLRLPKEKPDLKGQLNAWNDWAQRVWRMAQHDTALHGAKSRGLEKLRRAWDHGVRALASQLRKLLGGHGADVPKGLRSGQDQQRRRVQPGELPVGVTKNQLQKQETHPLGGDQREKEAPDRLSCRNWDRIYDTPVPTGSRLSVRETPRRAGRDQPVYDVIDCGPRHQYVVLGKTGPIIVHNCTQATARDCLRDAMFALDEAGFDIRAHVHDEVIITEPLDGRGWEDVAEIMSRPLPWAEGLPLNAAGYDGAYYFKD